MVKKVLFSILLLVLMLSVVSAESNETAQINKAYLWLTDAVNNFTGLSTEENSFALLALSYDSAMQSKGISELDDKRDGDCWTEGSCNVKDTAMAIIALSNLRTTADYEEWLLNENSTPTDLEWYIQIDSDEDANCTITYDDEEDVVSIDEDGIEIEENRGFCFLESDYWLKIKSSCYSKKFVVNCDQDYVASFLYKLLGESEWHVPSESFSETAYNDVEMIIESKCFGKPCNYEGSLWSAYALSKKNYDVSMFLPYIAGYASEKEKYLPEAFLYMITGKESYALQLLDRQNPEGYWSAKSKFYDTGLALLALKDYTDENVTKAENYLLKKQSSDGSWGGNKRDTALILYAVWGKGGGTSIGNECYENNGVCIDINDCSYEDELPYYCVDSGKVCCKSSASETCAELGGTICLSNEYCNGSIETAKDSSFCCIDGECVLSELKTCREIGGVECGEDEVCSNDDYTASSDTLYCCVSECVEKGCYDLGGEICGSGERCSGDEQVVGGEKCCLGKCEKGKNLAWLWFIIILLVVAGVVYYLYKKGKIDFSRFFMFFRKRKKGVRIVSGTRKQAPVKPAASPFPRFSGQQFRMPARRRSLRVPVRPKTKEEKEMEDTFKKLREMGK